MVYLRAMAVWLLLMLAETMHGTARIFLLVPLTGDTLARQITVFTGAAIIFTITYLLIKWINATRTSQLFVIGFNWVVFTLTFEITLGLTVFSMKWEQIMRDYNPGEGGLMPVGLTLMFFTPYLAYRIKNRKSVG